MSVEEAMDEGHRHRAFADRQGDAPYRVVANVAGGEDAGDVGLEEVRIAVEGPARRPSARLARSGVASTWSSSAAATRRARR